MDDCALEGVHGDDGTASFGSATAVTARQDVDGVDLCRIKEPEQGDEALVGITVPRRPAEEILFSVDEVDHLFANHDRTALALDIRQEAEDAWDCAQQNHVVGVPDLVAFCDGDRAIGRGAPVELKGFALKERVLCANPMKRGIRHGSSLAIQD